MYSVYTSYDIEAVKEMYQSSFLCMIELWLTVWCRGCPSLNSLPVAVSNM